MNSRTRWPALLAIIAVGILTDCSRTGTSPTPQSGGESTPAGAQGNLLTAESQALLRAAIDGGNSDLHWPDFTDYTKHVKKFYDLSGGTLWWVKDLEPTPQARQLITLLLQAGQKGLSAEDYDGPLWSNRLAALKPSTRQPAEANAVKFDRRAYGLRHEVYLRPPHRQGESEAHGLRVRRGVQKIRPGRIPERPGCQRDATLPASWHR